MTPTRDLETTVRWRNRTTGHGEEAPDQLLANRRNWRVHPDAQQETLAASRTVPRGPLRLRAPPAVANR